MSEGRQDGIEQSNGSAWGQRPTGDLPVGDIPHRMDQLRRELRINAANLSEEAQRATHPSYYIRRFPLACVGIAALAGFVLVPPRQKQPSPSDEQLARLVESGKVTVHATPSPQRELGFARKAALMIGSFALQSALAYAGEQWKQASGSGSDNRQP